MRSVDVGSSEPVPPPPPATRFVVDAYWNGHRDDATVTFGVELTGKRLVTFNLETRHARSLAHALLHEADVAECRPQAL